MPPQINESRQWPLGPDQRDSLRSLVAAHPFDPARLAKEYFDAGRRLG